MYTEGETIRKLITDYLSNKIDADQLKIFLEGFDESKVEKEYDKVLKGYFDDLVLKEKEEQTDGLDYNEKIKEAKVIIDFKKENNNGFSSSNLWSSVSGIAATVSVICAIIAMFWIMTQEKSDKNETLVINLEERYTKPGTKASYTLSDGSFIHLNAASNLSFPEAFSEKNRIVKMGGEAYFNIKRDEERPFIIETDELKIKVLGTSFDVKAYEEEEEISVSVESGKVMVSGFIKNSKKYILTKNQKLIYNKVSNKYSVVDIDIISELNWREGILKFNHTSFSEIEHQLERWYGVDIEVEDKSVYSRKISGVHKNENLKAVLESLKFAFGIDYEIKGKTVKLKTF